MTSPQDPDIEAVLKRASDDLVTFWRRDSTEYNNHVQVKNARLHTSPQVIAPCADARAFSYWLRALKGYEVPISIRSGGHHHEGMCSNNGGVVLLAPAVDDVCPDLDANTVWLNTAQPLGEVMDQLGDAGRILPTGGCATVNVGGLTHGGGWGMSYRRWGLTSDALLAVELVLPNGDVVMINRDGSMTGATTLDFDPVDLFWAIRGGGGGNFGVATRFQFEIFEPKEDVYTEFTLQWRAEDRAQVATRWAKLCETAPDQLNTFARMTVEKKLTRQFWNPDFLVGGRFYGKQEACEAALADFIGDTDPPLKVFKEVALKGAEAFRGAMMLAPEDGLRVDADTVIPPQGYVLQPGPPNPDGPSSTCVTAALPHKITSMLPLGNHAEIMQRASDYIAASKDHHGAAMYLSLHGLGGAGNAQPAEAGAFPWRDKSYILQVQTWWNEDDVPLIERAALLAWVAGFREAMCGGEDPLCHGGFINFPDHLRDRKDGDVADYYGASWPKLCAVKHQLDPDNRLAFPMGIPPLVMD